MYVNVQIGRGCGRPTAKNRSECTSDSANPYSAEYDASRLDKVNLAEPRYNNMLKPSFAEDAIHIQRVENYY